MLGCSLILFERITATQMSPYGISRRRRLGSRKRPWPKTKPLHSITWFNEEEYFVFFPRTLFRLCRQQQLATLHVTS